MDLDYEEIYYKYEERVSIMMIDGNIPEFQARQLAGKEIVNELSKGVKRHDAIYALYRAKQIQK